MKRSSKQLSNHIPGKDWVKIIWRIRGSLGDEFLNTLKSAVRVGSKCLVGFLDETKDRILELYFDSIRTGQDFLDAGLGELGIEIKENN